MQVITMAASSLNNRRKKSLVSEYPVSWSSSRDSDSSLHSQKPRSVRAYLQTTLHILLLLLGVLSLSWPLLNSVSKRTSSPPPSRQTTTSETATSLLLPSNDDCSCLNPHAPSSHCCQRMLWRAHKMGVVLLREYFPGIPSQVYSPQVPTTTTSSSSDYRHVALLRPVDSSIVSGYLYHKQGRECWLDQYGNRQPKNKTVDWQSYLQYPVYSNHTICQYLVEHSLEDGMKAYMDFSLNELYRGIAPHKAWVLQNEHTTPKTLYVCFQDFENDLLSTYRRILQWLYPTQDNVATAVPPDYVKEGAKLHGTQREGREALMTLVKQLDEQYFEGKAKILNEIIGCDRAEEAMVQ